MFDDLVERAERELAAAGLEALSWRERVRTALWTIRCLLDREPVLARVCLAEGARAGGPVAERRAAVLARLVAALEDGHPGCSRGERCGPLTGEGLVGAALAIVHVRVASAASPTRGG